MKTFLEAINEAKLILGLSEIFYQGADFAQFDSPKLGIVELHKSYPINGNPNGWIIVKDKSSLKKGADIKTLHILN